MRARAAIVVEEATKVIDGVTVLDRVSFRAEPGSVTAFMGPNGAGKTTTLRVLLGLTRLTSGRATIGGRPLQEHPQPMRVAGALLTPDAGHPKRTARGHLRVAAASNGLGRSSVDGALELAGICGIADLPIGQMSLGMRQRLGLATALIGDPAVLILDEPHNGLDAGAIRWLRVLLRTLADGGRTILLSSHLMYEIEQFCDDVVVIDEGRVLMTGPLGHFADATSVRNPNASLEDHYFDMVEGR